MGGLEAHGDRSLSLSSVPSKRREDWERSVFVRAKEGGYRLRENVLFHLYVSTSPCGDARLNSPYEITTDKRKRTPSHFPASSPDPAPGTRADPAGVGPGLRGLGPQRAA